MIDPIDEYSMPQPKGLDGKKLKTTAKEGLDIADEDEKKKLEEMKAEFEPLTNHQVDEPSEIRWRRSSRMADSPCVLTTSEYGWSANMERNSMTSHMVSKNTMAVNPKHSGAEEEAGRCRQVGQASNGFNLDEATQFAGRIHCTIKLGLSIDDDDEGLPGDDDLPPLEEVEGAAGEASKMEEFDLDL
ncbi:unnamed protein product [Symbiodinium microadriaticum]|nr:unnamed protein product [Symbiodinium microadriaticum]